MEAALANAGEVAASLPLPLYADEAVDRFVPLCLAKVKAPALPKLKMVKDLDHEVRQYWVHSDTEEDEQGGQICFVSQGPVSTGTSLKRIARARIKKRGTRGGGKGGTSGRQGVSTGGVDPAVGFEKLVSATTSSMRGGGAGGIGARRRPVGSGPRLRKGIKPEYARPLCYHVFHHDLSAFSLDEESTIQPLRHTAAPASVLKWSANILSIKVLCSSVGYPVSLYGSVYVRDALDHKRVYLFRRDRDNAQLEETLALTGPSRGLVVVDNLFFEIDLKMKCDQVVDGMNFSQGSMEYSNVSNSSWLINHRSCVLTDELSTEVSTVELMYAPVRRAVEASIQIKALEGSPHREGIFSPYGKVTAFITDIEEEIVLFDSESSGAVMNIRDDGSFELWRSVISVPIDGSLTLTVETWEGDAKVNFNRCSTIFMPQICDENVAPCIFHPIMMKVAWSPLYVPMFGDLKITV